MNETDTEQVADAVSFWGMGIRRSKELCDRRHLTPLRPSSISNLKGVKFSLELLDCAVSRFEVLVEPVAFGDEMLLPLPEASLFGLDLLGEALPQSLLFLLELGVVELLDLRLAVLPSLHLLLTVVLIV